MAFLDDFVGNDQHRFGTRPRICRHVSAGGQRSAEFRQQRQGGASRCSGQGLRFDVPISITFTHRSLRCTTFALSLANVRSDRILLLLQPVKLSRRP